MLNEKLMLAGKTAYIIVNEGRLIPTRTFIKKCKIIAADKKGGEAVVILDGTEIEFFVPPKKLFRTKKRGVFRFGPIPSRNRINGKIFLRGEAMTFIDENGNREEYRPLNPWRDEDLDKLVNRILFGRAGIWVTFDQLLKLIDWGDNLSRQQTQETRIRLRGAIRRLLVSGAIQRRREGQAAYRKIDQETLDLFETALMPGRQQAEGLHHGSCSDVPSAQQSGNASQEARG